MRSMYLFIIVFGLLFTLSCGDIPISEEQKEKKEDLIEIVKEKDEKFRERIKELLTEWEEETGIAIEEEKFSAVIFADGNGLIVNVPLELQELPTEEQVAKGMDLFMTYMNLPEGADLQSGFYIVGFYQDQTGNWKAVFKDIYGNVVYETEATIETHKPRNNVYPTIEVDEFDFLVIINGCIDSLRGKHIKAKINMCQPQTKSSINSFITHGCTPPYPPIPENPLPLKMVNAGKEFFSEILKLDLGEGQVDTAIIGSSSENTLVNRPRIVTPDGTTVDIILFQINKEEGYSPLETDIYTLEIRKEGETYKGVLKDSKGNVVENAIIDIQVEPYYGDAEWQKKIPLDIVLGDGCIGGSMKFKTKYGIVKISLKVCLENAA